MRLDTARGRGARGGIEVRTRATSLGEPLTCGYSPGAVKREPVQ